jgi:hypothetical protein
MNHLSRLVAERFNDIWGLYRKFIYFAGRHGRWATIESTLDCAQVSQSDALTCKLIEAQEKKAIKIYMINLRSRVDFGQGNTK